MFDWNYIFIVFLLIFLIIHCSYRYPYQNLCQCYVLPKSSFQHYLFKKYSTDKFNHFTKMYTSSTTGEIHVNNPFNSLLTVSMMSQGHGHGHNIRMPRHVAYIVDGNGRWAQQKGLDRSTGHSAGANKTVEIVKDSFEMGVDVITLYLFSTENWKRPRNEIQNIMNLLDTYLKNFSSYLKDNQISLRVIGQVYRLPKTIQTLIETIGHPSDEIKESSRILCLAISYGGRDDIIQACKYIMESKIDSHEITEDVFSKYTYTGKLGIPDPDIIVRTSGEIRLSNFLLWQSAYAEFASIDSYWPDFSLESNRNILSKYSNISRRFGSLSS